MLTVNCQSSIKIAGTKIIYFDPLNVAEEHDADYILITHTHWDHFKKEDILKIKNLNTKIIGPKDIINDCLELGFKEKDIITLKPYEQLSVEKITIKTVPAYNKTADFHPKQNFWLGYILTLDDETYYIMGDTDSLEENTKIKCDTLLIPIGGTYTMDAKEAANFTNKISPKTVIPIHYGLVVGTKKDLDYFKENINSNIKIVEKIETINK